MAQTKLNDFEVLSKLGEGSYSEVFKVVRKNTNAIYAMKKVKLFDLKEKEKENALNEVRILASFNDPHIVSYKEVFLDDNCLCIIMEFASGGDLQLKIREAQKSGYIPEKEIWKVLFHITKGLKKLHDMKIVHRDLKAANIFVGENNVYKLGDLNVSKITKKGFAYTQTGTPYYASPEVWRNEPYNQQSDIWSLGCVIYELATLKLPFKAQDLQQLCQKVQRGLFEQLPRNYSRDLQTIISQMIQVLPLKRLSCNQILNHNLLLKNIRGDELQKSELQSNELLQTIQLPRNIKQLKLPKSNYGGNDVTVSTEQVKQSKQLKNQRAHSALPGQIKDKDRNLSPLNSVQQKKIDPATPVSQPSQRVKSAMNKEKMLQDQLKLELKREQQKLLDQRQKTEQYKSLQQQQQQQPQQRLPMQKPEMSADALRQQIIKNHNKLDELKVESKQVSAPYRQEQSKSPHQVPPSRQKSQPEIVKRERIIVSAQPTVKQQQENRVQQQMMETINNNEFILSGLKNINPQSIQSILCQPVLQVNESPFPTRAKVSKTNGKKSEGDTNLIKDNYQHFFPIQQEQKHIIHSERKSNRQ